MTAAKPLLARDDLPLEAIAEICRRYGVLEMAVDPSQTRPPRNPSYLLEDDPFAAVDLYLIADFGPGPYDWGFKKHHSDVVEALGDLLGRRVWIDDKGILEKHVSKGSEWAEKEIEGRDVIYTRRVNAALNAV